MQPVRLLLRDVTAPLLETSARNRIPSQLLKNAVDLTRNDDGLRRRRRDLRTSRPGSRSRGPGSRRLTLGLRLQLNLKSAGSASCRDRTGNVARGRCRWNNLTRNPVEARPSLRIRRRPGRPCLAVPTRRDRGSWALWARLPRWSVCPARASAEPRRPGFRRRILRRYRDRDCRQSHSI